ncbi:uncharacterized protein LOC109862486 [Pseudomyrmex gracilis]|uniref:uncharacterized protein LOC109862486 n=1 Tax=Pseudomyrmex gracilis TaxID=219809 RepID=UPI0009959550|nr:uncharacterized protein LOC109862486 [Pseudomyrmex gracilis]
MPYAEVMRLAREKNTLHDLGIGETRVRKDVRGGILVEIPGPNGAAKATRLDEALTPALQGKATVSCPVRRGELRFTGLDDLVSADELVARLSSAEFGGCQASDITIGPVTEGRDRLGAMWVRCPLEVATKVAEAWPPSRGVVKC